MGKPKSLRPFFSFYGGKWRAAPRYPTPRYDTVIEPFAGSAGYSLRYYDRQVILVERDEKVFGTWDYLLKTSEQEILSLPDLEPGQTVDDLTLCQEARWLIGWWLNKGTASPSKTPSAWMRQGTHDTSYWGLTVRERIASQLQYIRHWKIIHGIYADAPDIEATWFVDPPYQEAGKHYRYGSDQIDYASLAEWCRYWQGQVIVCENVGAEWLPFEPYINIKASESSRGGKVSKEAIWLNDVSKNFASPT